MNIKLLVAKGLKIVLHPAALAKCNIDKTSKVCAQSELSLVRIGKYTYVGGQCFIHNAEIGNYCSIASKCTIGGAMHPLERVSTSPVFHVGRNVLKTNFALHSAVETPKTIVENDVWLGMGCFIKAGVTIHNGAVIGMGSVVTKDVPPYEIWAGVPAKKIRDRFNEQIKERMLSSEWWFWDKKRIKAAACSFDNVENFLAEVEKNEHIGIDISLPFY